MYMINPWSSLLKKLFHSRFVRNWSFLTFSNIVSRVLGMAATIRIARLLEPEGFGQFGIVQMMAVTGTVVAGIGIRNVVTRQTATHPEMRGSLFLSSAVIQAIAFIPVIIGIWFYCQFSNQGISVSLYVVVVGLLLGLLIWELVESIAFGQERMEYSSGINIAGSVIWVVFAWMAPCSWLTLFRVCLAFALLQGAKALAYILAGKLSGFLRINVRDNQYGYLLRSSMPFYWLALLSIPTIQLPIFFLLERSGQMETGLYNAGMRLAGPFQMVMYTGTTALYPVLCKLAVSDKEQFMQKIRQILFVFVIGGTIGAFAITILRYELVTVLFGSSFYLAANTLSFLCWNMVFLAIFALIGTILAASNNQKILAKLATCYAILATPIIWWGAGRGATEMALAMLVASALNMSYHWVILEKKLPARFTVFYRMGLLSVLAGGFIAAFGVPQTLPWTIRGAICFILTAILLIFALTPKSIIRKAYLQND